MSGEQSRKLSKSRSDEELEKLRDRIIRGTLQRPRSERCPDLPALPPPRPQVLLIRGLGSWPDDKTFRELEQRLIGAEVGVTRFSYFGSGFSHYEPVDTIRSLDKVIIAVQDHIEKAANKGKLWVVAHSFGGIALTHWACHPTNDTKHTQLLSKIEGAILFASPVFVKRNRFRITHPRTKRAMDVELGDYSQFNSRICELLPRVHVAYCAQDAMCPAHEASFKERREVLGADPLSEQIISDDCTHDEICNRHDLVDFVMGIISSSTAISA